MQSDHKRPRRFMLLALLATLPIAAYAGNSAVVKSGAEVRSAPSAGAQPVVQAPANEAVEIHDRRGAWYEVSSSSGWRGWVRLASIKITSLTQTKSKTTLPGQPTAVVGVRGLDEAALARAQPDYAALERLRQYRSTPQDAQRFAAELSRAQVSR
jgi:hypothetical protein